MTEKDIDIYIIPTTDFHGSEYVNDYFKCREYVSGFTGSAGTLVVMRDRACLWTDGRYFLQAEHQLEGSGIDLMKMGMPGVPDIPAYIKEQLDLYAAEANASYRTERRDGSGMQQESGEIRFTIGFDGRTMSRRMGEELQNLCADERGEWPGRFRACIAYDMDLAGDIWKDRPQIIPSEIYPLSSDVTGESPDSKLQRIRQQMNSADWLLVSRLEDIAWIYDLRGRDVKHTPVFYGYALISADSDTLYVMDESYMKKAAQRSGSSVKPYDRLADDLMSLRDCTVMMDESSVSYAVSESFDASVRRVFAESPAAKLKAVKNSTEIKATRNAHLRDGAAMAEFLCWLKSEIKDPGSRITEISLADHLEECRRAQGAYDLSFDTIAGYEEHGAVIHYSASPETDAELRPEGFVLIDSGGQYDDGTTDITRTVALGPVSEDRRRNYTAVLKSHIALASAVFGPQTTGYDLDVIARKPLKALGLDFRHGTGHGVGHMLSVHEGPNTITPGPSGKRCHIVPGMITSDEPGVYLEGEYGIRIENEILCTDGKDGYAFEMLTLCPYEREAIDITMLTEDEIKYIDDYHSRVYEMLTPVVSREAAGWLREQCRPLERP